MGPQKEPLFPGLLSEPQLGDLRLGLEQLDLGGPTEWDPSRQPARWYPASASALGSDAPLPTTVGLAQATAAHGGQ